MMMMEMMRVKPTHIQLSPQGIMITAYLERSGDRLWHWREERYSSQCDG